MSIVAWLVVGLVAGWLGSMIVNRRGDGLVMDIVLLVVLSNPFIMGASFRFAKNLKYNFHMNIQKILLLISLFGVFIFELDIRFRGGERAFLEGSPYVNSLFLKYFLIFHITFAILSYLAWIVLLVFSLKRFSKSLPGSFSVNHKFFGKIIFAGMIITALSGSIIYILAFVVL